jgi:hypothetical protein
MYVKNSSGVINFIPVHLELDVMQTQMGRGVEVLSLSEAMYNIENASFENPQMKKQLLEWTRKVKDMYPSVVTDTEYENKGEPTFTTPTNYDFDAMTKKDIADILHYTGDLKRITKDELIKLI